MHYKPKLGYKYIIQIILPHLPNSSEHCRSWIWRREIGRKTLSSDLREDEKMGETSRGAAESLTVQRTDHMMLVITIGIVFSLAVGGFVMAANSLGDQKPSPLDDPQKIVLDSFDLAETAQPQSLGEPSFVWESESGCWGPLCTEQGWIDFYDDNLPDELPLCLDNEFLREWYVDVLVFGGYNPWEECGYIDVFQKCEYKGTINIVWTWMGKGECCAYDYWRATFYVDDIICLESNKYPDVSPWTIDYPADQETIPGKCVYFHIMTYWTGCVPGEQPSQDFTIIPTQSYTSFLKVFHPHFAN